MIKEIKRLLDEHLVKSDKDCIDDVIKNHHSYLEQRQKNKPDKK